MRPSEALETHRDAIRSVLSRFPLTNTKVFGSVARGEDTEESDLDLLVERAGTLTYFDLAKIEIELEQLLGVRVGVHTTGEFGPRSTQRIQRDAKAL